MAYAAMLFIPFIGSVHLFDWDEINFAESAREMLLTGDYMHVQINFTPFWEKPPFFFWLQALSMKIFGVNEFAARFPNAVCGIITLAALFFIGKREASRTVAIWWVLFMAGSFTPHLYYKSGIIDPWFNLFIFLSLYQFIRASRPELVRTPELNYVYAGLFAGLAFITKGPVALLVIALCLLTYIAMHRFRIFFSFRHLFLALFPFLFVASLWIAAEVNQNGWSVLVDFINYQIDLFKNPVAGHGQPFYYHAIVLLIGCFPASLFFIAGFRLNYISPERKHFALWMSIMFWVVLILFSSVTTKIVHYSSLCYIPLTFIAASYTDHVVNARKKFPVLLHVAFAIFAVLLGMLLTILPFIESFKSKLIPYIKDEFAIDSLNIPSPWNGNEFIPGLLFLLVYVFYMLMSAQQRTLTATRLLLLGSSLLIPLYLFIVVPKIEAYSQRPAIEFYEELAAQNVYVETLGHKSYAQYFYTKSNPRPDTSHEWLMSDQTDKPVYFVAKTTYWRNNPDDRLEEVKRKGGFVLLRKKQNR
jgi:hypothetical protein